MSLAPELEPFRYTKAARRLLRPATERIEALVGEEKDEELIFQGLMALGKIGDPISLPVMQSALDRFPDSPEPIVALGVYKNSTPVPRLLKLLEDPDFEFKEETVRTLGEIADPMSSKALLVLIRDSDRMVRYYAAWALYRLGGRDVAQQLCRLLSDPDEWIVINVLEILAQLKEKEAIPALVGQFEIAQDARLKAIIISSLGCFNEPKLLHVFEEGLKSFDPRIQANAVEAIAQLKIPALELKRKLKRFFGHANNRLRANVAVALSVIDPDSVKGEVESMIASTDVATRRSAAYVLSRVQTTDRDSLVDRLLADSAYMVRKMALKAALSMDTELGTNRILPLLKDKNSWVRKEAVECARKMSRFPIDPVLEIFKAEVAPPVIDSILDFMVERKLNQAVPLVLTKIKGQAEESLPRMITALGRLQAREALQESRKFVGAPDADLLSRFHLAMLLHGDLGIFAEVANGLKGKPREDELMALVKSSGEIGAFIQTPETFSDALNKSLLPEIEKDMQGVATLSSAPSRPPEESVLKKGIELFHQERYDDAIHVLEPFLKWHPGNLEARYYLAASQNQKGLVEEAIQQLIELRKGAPGHIPGGLLLGQIYFQKKDWKSLAEEYEDFRKHIPTEEKKILGQVRGALGLTYFHLRAYKKAEEMLKAALLINPRDLSSSYHLALTHVALKDYAPATRLLRGLQTNLPTGSKVLRNVEDLLQKIEEDS